MKKLVILGAFAAMTLVAVAPAEALNIHVGPRGVGVGIGHRGYVRRGPVRRPFVRRGPVRHFRRF